MSIQALAFRVGAVGEPGRRTFYLQFDAEDGSHWYVLEKGQLAALAAAAGRLLADVEYEAPAAEAADLVPPEGTAWRIEDMSLGITENQAELTLSATDPEVDPVSYLIPFPLLAAAAVRAIEVVAAGRPACPRCGLAIDPGGHTCPANNGDLRGHRE